MGDSFLESQVELTDFMQKQLVQVSKRANANALPWNEHYKYKSHKSKVLKLYKRAWYTTQDWCYHTGSREAFFFELSILRARFDKFKDEPDMVKATALLKAGEEEWWLNRHPSPILFPWSEGGVAFQRNRKNSHAGTILQSWRPEDRARYTDVLPAAKEYDGLPPFWWGHATRGFERCDVMHW